MKLAPRLFDPAVVDHEQRQHQLDLKWETEWKAAIEKVYGEPCVWPDPWWESRTNVPPELLPEVTMRLAQWDSSLHQAREMKRLSRELQPHNVPTLNQICDLMEIAFAFGRIATGMETARKNPLPPLDDHSQFRADLKRTYPSDANTVRP